jgi:hypothetical protein
LEGVDREASAGLEPTFESALAELTPPDGQVVIAFRIGLPTHLSPRRPAEEVLLT